MSHSPFERYCDKCAYKKGWFWPTIDRIVTKCLCCGEERVCNRR